MQTLSPILRLGRDIWDSANLPVEEFKARAERLQTEMDRAGIGVLLLYGKAHDNCGYPVYLSYHVLKSPRASLVVLPRDGAPVLIIQDASRGLAAVQATTWIEDIRPCGNVGETCASVLAEKTLLSATVGLAGVRRLMPYGQCQTLLAALDHAKLVDAEPFVEALRSIKSSREIAQVRRASQIVRRVLENVAAKHSGPVNESMLAADLMRDARIQGAEDVRVLIATPLESGWTFRPVQDAAIGNGEKIVLHIAACWERYWAESARTYAATSRGLECVSSAAQDAAFGRLAAAVNPGRTAAEYVRTAAAEMGPSHAALIEEYGFGSGIGITPKEPPILAPDNQTMIERGMCLAIRAALPDNRGGFIVRADTVVAGEDGAKIAT